MPEGLVSIPEAARILNVGQKVLRTAIEDGQVTTVSFGKRTWLTSEEVEATRTRLYGKADN